jgi:adenylate cyclase
MIETVRRWNEKRARRGASAVRIGIGLHFGPVVVGNTGDARRLELAVIGDTVNVASRLERETRRFATEIACSADVMAAVRREGTPVEIIEGFVEAGTVELRGRPEPLSVWIRRGSCAA